MMRLALGLLLGAATLLLLASFAGGFVAPFDTLAIVAPYVAVIVLLTVILWRRAPVILRVVSGVSALAALIPVVALALQPAAADGPSLRLLQHNIFYLNDGRLLPEVIEGHDVATFQEVQSLWVALRTLPSPWIGVDCPFAPGIGTAVATRLPLIETGCLNEGEAWARLESPLGPVTVVSLHLPWPWPAGGDKQAQQVAELSRQIARLPQPVVIGGDFNQMPWSDAVQQIARAARGHVTPGLRATFIKVRGILRLPIDHVIIPDGWSAETQVGPTYRSDHNSVTARIVAAQ